VAFEVELLNERFDVPEESIWRVINLLLDSNSAIPLYLDLSKSVG
jgi:hypothetical protein